MTSAPLHGFVGITRRRQTNVFGYARSFVHMTSAPVMTGYRRKMFRDFAGITRRRQTNVFCLWTIVQNIKHVDRPKHCFETKIFGFFTSRRWIFVFRRKVHRLGSA
jgi:hypothetical protein